MKMKLLERITARTHTEHKYHKQIYSVYLGIIENKFKVRISILEYNKQHGYAFPLCSLKYLLTLISDSLAQIKWH